MNNTELKITTEESNCRLYRVGSSPYLDIMLADCNTYMDEMIRNKIKVDCILTDPPFFTPATHYQSRVSWDKSWSDMSILETWWRVVIEKMHKILKDDGHILVFCNGDSYPVFYPVMFSFWDKLKGMVWDKGHVGLGRIFRNQHELVIWGRNTGHYVPNDGKLRADVFKYKATGSKDREHPVEKPTDMLKYLIDATCPENGIVFDPFMGSGTTGMAAFDLKRNFIGIEKDAKYYEMVKKRFKNFTAQQRLF